MFELSQSVKINDFSIKECIACKIKNFDSSAGFDFDITNNLCLSVLIFHM